MTTSLFQPCHVWTVWKSMLIAEVGENNAFLRVFSDEPGIIGCFGSFSIIPCIPGDTAGADQTLLVSRWLATCDSVVLLFWATTILRPPLPHRWYGGWLVSFLLCLEWAAKPLHPTSTGRPLALHPDCWHLLTSPAYLKSFPLDPSSKRSSNGTDGSSSIAFLDLDTRGQYVVTGWWLQYG